MGRPKPPSIADASGRYPAHEGERGKRIPLEIQQIGRRKSRMLNNSQNITDSKVPPSNRLEKQSLKED